MSTNRREKKRKLPIGFGSRLNKSITNSGLSVSEIERLSGVNHSNICDYISEKMLPSAYNLYALCKTLNVSADYLLGLED